MGCGRALNSQDLLSRVVLGTYLASPSAPMGHLLASAGTDKTILLWDLRRSPSPHRSLVSITARGPQLGLQPGRQDSGDVVTADYPDVGCGDTIGRRGTSTRAHVKLQGTHGRRNPASPSVQTDWWWLLAATTARSSSGMWNVEKRSARRSSGTTAGQPECGLQSG